MTTGVSCSSDRAPRLAERAVEQRLFDTSAPLPPSPRPLNPHSVPSGKIGHAEPEQVFQRVPDIGTEEFVAELEQRARVADAQPYTAARVARNGLSVVVIHYRPVDPAGLSEAEEEAMLDEDEDDLARRLGGEP